MSEGHSETTRTRRLQRRETLSESSSVRRVVSPEESSTEVVNGAKDTGPKSSDTIKLVVMGFIFSAPCEPLSTLVRVKSEKGGTTSESHFVDCIESLEVFPFLKTNKTSTDIDVTDLVTACTSIDLI